MAAHRQRSNFISHQSFRLMGNFSQTENLKKCSIRSVLQATMTPVSVMVTFYVMCNISRLPKAMGNPICRLLKAIPISEHFRDADYEIGQALLKRTRPDIVSKEKLDITYPGCGKQL
nr:hypothetical protein [Tanacetum cinerariifolium]